MLAVCSRRKQCHISYVWTHIQVTGRHESVAEILPGIYKSSSSIPSTEKNVFKLTWHPSSVSFLLPQTCSTCPCSICHISVTFLYNFTAPSPCTLHWSFLTLQFSIYRPVLCLKISHHPFEENTLSLQLNFNFLSFSPYKFDISVCLELESSFSYYLSLIISTGKIVFGQVSWALWAPGPIDLTGS
jgi:hypothetical protein